MPEHDIIVIGASAGGVEALKHLISKLPGDLAAAVFIVVHIPATSVSILPELLSRWGPLTVTPPTDGARIVPGHIYVAPPDFHLLLESGRMRLLRGPRENHTRPAIDPLFRTAAQAYGKRVVAVLLSGMLNDGTAGMIEVKRCGGIAIVQSPEDALFGDMPRSALNNVAADFVLPAAQIASQLVQLTLETRPQKKETLMSNPIPDAGNGASGEGQSPASNNLSNKMSAEDSRKMDAQQSNAIVLRDTAAQISGERNAVTSIYSCPDCGGVLWQMNDDGFIRFRCHVGHAFSAESLLHQQSEALEESMWYAVRTLIDKSKLSRQLAERAQERGHSQAARHFEEQARVAAQHAGVIRDLIESGATSKNLEPSEAPVPML